LPLESPFDLRRGFINNNVILSGMMAANGGEMPEFTAKEMLGYYLKSVAEGEFQIAGTTMGESLDGLVLDLGGPRDGTVQM